MTKLETLARCDVEFCEQPIPAGTPERLRWIRERSRVAIVTDEDSKNADDLLALAGCVDGINVKLVKCGGIRGALAMIATARALGLKVMLGCMVESRDPHNGRRASLAARRLGRPRRPVPDGARSVRRRDV